MRFLVALSRHSVPSRAGTPRRVELLLSLTLTLVRKPTGATNSALCVPWEGKLYATPPTHDQPEHPSSVPLLMRAIGLDYPIAYDTVLPCSRLGEGPAPPPTTSATLLGRGTSGQKFNMEGKK